MCYANLITVRRLLANRSIGCGKTKANFDDVVRLCVPFCQLACCCSLPCVLHAPKLEFGNQPKDPEVHDTSTFSHGFVCCMPNTRDSKDTFLPPKPWGWIFFPQQVRIQDTPSITWTLVTRTEYRTSSIAS